MPTKRSQFALWFAVSYGLVSVAWIAGSDRLVGALFKDVPTVTRLQTYDVSVDEPALAAYCAAILALPEMREWTAAALQEPEAIDELEVEF